VTRRLRALALACAVLVALLYVFFVRTELGQRIDDAALDGRAELTANEVQDADDLLQTIDLSSVALLGGAIVVVGFVRGRLSLAAAAVIVLLGANVATQLMKEVLARPDFVPSQAQVGIGNSLPSGHTTVAASIALAAVLVAPKRLRGLVALVGSLYAAAIGVAVLTAGWHRPSDAVAAFAMATGWAAVASLVVADRPKDRAEIESESTVVSPLLVTVGALGCAVSFGVLVIALTALRLDRLDTINFGRAYTAGTVAIVGTAFLLTGVLLFALRPDREPTTAAVP
jgi:membrane-associated phospholipid phosphatase